MDSSLDFERRARLAAVWNELANPARGILGYQEIILEECRKLGLGDLLPSLEKVLTAARALNTLVDSLRHPSSAAPTDIRGSDLVDEQARLRHDLRTPLNAIIGYSEMAVEDVEGLAGAEALRSDLKTLLDESRQLLEQIEDIVSLAWDAPGAEKEAPDGLAQVAVTELLRTLQPKEGLRKLQEIGRILVVDDNESNRSLLARRLAKDGHEVALAESGAKTFEILAQQSFDLILLDLLMPEMSGLEVLARLKADERWYQIPVIMISGLSESDAVLRCIEAGAEDYLPKPCDVVLLRARINACLERKRWHEREREYLAQLSDEKAKSDTLIRNILPEPVVLRLNDGETVIADRFDAVSILFADIVGFTPAAATMTPASLVKKLDRVFSEFDMLAQRLGVEKIKTIGDAYMAAAGLPEPRPDHAEAIAEFAVGIIETLLRLDEPGEPPLAVRIGIHSGPAVAGIIGRHKFIYDVWGDTVNVASRLESHGEPGRIQVSGVIRDALAHRFAFEPRGNIMLKGKGQMDVFFLTPLSG